MAEYEFIPSWYVGVSSRRQKARLALGLRRAAHATPTLKAELPLAEDTYTAVYKVYLRRFEHLAKLNNTGELYSTVIAEKSARVLGMASLQLWHPSTLPLELADNGASAELSYWHRPVGGVEGVELGKQIIERITDEKVTDPVIAKQFWTVTLPNDTIKAEVLQETGFERVAAVQPFNLDDEVVVPRQLWAREA